MASTFYPIARGPRRQGADAGRPQDGAHRSAPVRSRSDCPPFPRRHVATGWCSRRASRATGWLP